MPFSISCLAGAEDFYLRILTSIINSDFSNFKIWNSKEKSSLDKYIENFANDKSVGMTSVGFPIITFLKFQAPEVPELAPKS